MPGLGQPGVSFGAAFSDSWFISGGANAYYLVNRKRVKNCQNVCCKRILAVLSMTSNKNDCIPEQFRFGLVKSCPVVVNFNGEPVTSDAGLILIAELDRKREITSRLAACLKITESQTKFCIQLMA